MSASRKTFSTIGERRTAHRQAGGDRPLVRRLVGWLVDSLVRLLLISLVRSFYRFVEASPKISMRARTKNISVAQTRHTKKHIYIRSAVAAADPLHQYRSDEINNTHIDTLGGCLSNTTRAHSYARRLLKLIEYQHCTNEKHTKKKNASSIGGCGS